MLTLAGVQRHPIIYFCLFSCIFGWSLFIAHYLGFDLEPDGMPMGPVLAAIVVAVLGGKRIRSEWWEALRRIRAKTRWTILAVVVPLSIIILSVLINAVFGAPLPPPEAFLPGVNLLIVFLLMMVMVGVGEEAGWTAFMLPALLKKHSLTSTWVITSLVRVVWHVPLMLAGTLSWVVGLGGVVAFQFIVVWMYRRSNGVWMLAAIWHAVVNTTGGQYFFRLVSGEDQFRLGVIMTSLYVLTAAVIIVVERNRFGVVDLTRRSGDLAGDYPEEMATEAMSPDQRSQRIQREHVAGQSLPQN